MTIRMYFAYLYSCILEQMTLEGVYIVRTKCFVFLQKWIKHYASIFSNFNYDDSFLTNKFRSENSTISFDPPLGEHLTYNLPITEDELITIINKNLTNASHGQNNIHTAMLNNFYLNSLSYPRSLFNSIFWNNTYPPLWKL